MDDFEPDIAPTKYVRRTWQELQQSVRKMRKLGISQLSRAPSSFTFRRIKTASGILTRLYFLGVAPGHRENTIFFSDIYDDNDDTVLQWNPLLDSFPTTLANSQFSKEEQLLRERKRVASFGITSYDVHKAAGRFVFLACNSIYYCDDKIDPDTGMPQGSVYPIEVKSACSKPRLDPKLCPNNPDLLAYVSNGDIWVSHLTTNQHIQLTHVHNEGKLADAPRSAGAPSFIVQEEFDRYTGYWWQPLIVEQEGSPNVYRILYEEVDESDVEICLIASEDGVDEYRYPRPGTYNACSYVKLLEFELTADGQITNVVDKCLSKSLQQTFSWMEYLVRADWLPDGKSVYCNIMARHQQQLVIVVIEQSAFVPQSSPDIMTVDKQEPCMTIVHKQTSKVWLNVNDCLHFLPQEKEDELQFITATETSGYRHLCLFSVQLQNKQSTVADKSYSVCNSLNKVVLTDGEWAVSNNQVWVDEQLKVVYFIGYRDTPLETHMYAVSYDNPSTPVRLTSPGYSHIVAMDTELDAFVSVYSSLHEPSASQVFSISHSNGAISAQPCCTLLQPTGSLHEQSASQTYSNGAIAAQPYCTLLQPTVAASSDYCPPQLFEVNSSSGHTFYGLYLVPPNRQHGVKYPVVQYVYGGPQVQLVTNSYNALKFLRQHSLANQGYVVVMLDGRGSCNRGVAFESHIKHRLGIVEIEDQVEGLYHLSEQVDFLDLTRVAIHGWSYGGYLSLMGLVQRPDVYKLAIAGAPVTSWMYYDTGYTERYMDEPDMNQDGYQQGSVLHWADKFPSEENRLLIIHGMMDENVHFLHSSKLIDELIKSCKPYRLQVYPKERHGFRSLEANEHYETLVLSFLQDNL